jgi:hypothetical protein
VRSWGRVIATAGLMAVCLGVASATALASPDLGVSVFRTTTPISHSDERLVQQVVVENTGSARPSVGVELTCAGTPEDGIFWRDSNPRAHYTYQWLRDGQPIPSATNRAYNVAPADEGKLLQCFVNATNDPGGADLPITFSTASVPPVAVEPAPAAPINGEKLPRLEPLAFGAQTLGSKERCLLPEDWSPNGLTWSFQWLRNGLPIDNATASEYVLQESDTEPPSNIQCEAVASDAAGNHAVAVSTELFTPTSPEPPEPYVAPSTFEHPVITSSNTATGSLNVAVELPEGMETYGLRASGDGWSCTKQAPTLVRHATVACTRRDSLAPESTFPAIEIATHVGHDAPFTLVTRATAVGGGAVGSVTATDEFTVSPFEPFGFEAFQTQVLDNADHDFTQAGGHPGLVKADLDFNVHETAAELKEGFVQAANGLAKMVVTETPRGFVGNPQSIVENCLRVNEVAIPITTCPAGSVVGGIDLSTSEGFFPDRPIFALEPEFGAPAQFGFGVPAAHAIYTLTPELNAENGYAITLVTAPVVKKPELFSADVTLCGYGGMMGESGLHESVFEGCRKPLEVGAGTVPLLTNPTRCEAKGPTTRISADSWEEPDVFSAREFSAPALTGCEFVPFQPKIALRPTSPRADSSTGLGVELTMPTEGIETASGIAQANLADAIVTLPVGMAINPAVAGGLGACTQAELGMLNGVPDNEPARCPEASKIGTAEVQTPLLGNPLRGDVYVAQQGDNPFHSLLAIYLVIESPRDGIRIKIAGKVAPDPLTGQLTASFQEDPEAPFSSLELHLLSGSRGPLINPSFCGTYQIESRLSPWTAADPMRPTPAETVRSFSTYKVDSGPGGGPCPQNALAPRFTAGLANSTAGRTSSFSLGLSREDGSQRFTALNLALPPGLTGYLRGIPYCPDATLSSISEAEGTGAGQVASPSCPSASQIGTASVGVGAGPSPFFAETGHVYLAGPYKGAPLSLAIVAPAVAGPFDLGSVVVRSALQIDPETARISIESGAIPTILHGILLDIRDIRVDVDRPNFALAPTNCEPMAIGGQVRGELGGRTSLSQRFQVGDCQNLGFKPKLAISLKGSTKRTGHPALKAVLTYPKAGTYANVARAQVNLPHSEFIEQNNLNKTCTKPVLLEGKCPKSTIYGKAKAWTPLLEKPLEGNVYLVGGYGYKLPALVAELDGQIRVLLKGKVDSGPNKGIRNTFEAVPDAPVERFELNLKGGPKYSLLVNSENLCKRPQKAIARFTAQDGKVLQAKPVIADDCGKKSKGGGNKKHKGASKGHGK